MAKLLKSAADKKIIIGKFGSTQGIRGEIKVFPLTDFPDRFDDIKSVFVDDKEIRISSTRHHKHFIVMKLDGVNSPEEAARFTNKLLKVKRSDVAPLAEGEYYAFDIVGLSVINQEGETLGNVTEIIKTGSNDVYVTKTKEGKQILIPALKKVVTEINLAEGFMKVIWDENQEV